jgi:hypothetical protein
VNGAWSPGWGWVGTRWVIGGTSQIRCFADLDCTAQLGPGVAVCMYEPLASLGYCVAPTW